MSLLYTPLPHIILFSSQLPPTTILSRATTGRRAGTQTRPRQGRARTRAKLGMDRGSAVHARVGANTGARQQRPGSSVQARAAMPAGCSDVQPR